MQFIPTTTVTIQKGKLDSSGDKFETSLITQSKLLFSQVVLDNNGETLLYDEKKYIPKNCAQSIKTDTGEKYVHVLRQFFYTPNFREDGTLKSVRLAICCRDFRLVQTFIMQSGNYSIGGTFDKDLLDALNIAIKSEAQVDENTGEVKWPEKLRKVLWFYYKDMMSEAIEFYEHSGEIDHAAIGLVAQWDQEKLPDVGKTLGATPEMEALAASATQAGTATEGVIENDLVAMG